MIFKSETEKYAKALDEKRLYEQAVSEVANKAVDRGLWAKAFAESGGNKSAAEARYLNLRVEEMRQQRAAAIELEERARRPEELRAAKEWASQGAHKFWRFLGQLLWWAFGLFVFLLLLNNWEKVLQFLSGL